MHSRRVGLPFALVCLTRVPEGSNAVLLVPPVDGFRQQYDRSRVWARALCPKGYPSRLTVRDFIRKLKKGESMMLST